MPLAISTSKFSDGRPYAHVVGSGAVTGEQARGLMTRLALGGDLTGIPLLAVIEPKVDLDPEARKAFATLNDAGAKPIKAALVTPNAPMRVMLSFVIRLSPQVNETKFFATATEALAWLEK